MVLVVELVAVQVKLELAVVGGKLDHLGALDEFFALAAVGDERVDGAEFQAETLLEPQQLGYAGHRAVVVDDLRQHAGRPQTRQPREIDRCLGVARPAQHATVAVAQREHVTGAREVACTGARFGEQSDGECTVRRRDAGSHPQGGVHADRVGGTHPLGVGGQRGHQRQFEPVEFRTLHRHADHPAGVLDHEGDAFRGGFLGGENKVALVLAAGVVGDDDRFASAYVREDGVDGIKLAGVGGCVHGRRGLKLVNFAQLRSFAKFPRVSLARR